jgi:release factor glutamine methyltransferase
MAAVSLDPSADLPSGAGADLVARLRAAGCVFAEEEAALLTEAAADPDRLEHLVSRRVGGTPLEQLLGWAEFCGLRITVAPTVFVPRRRTELLVRVALEHAGPGDVVVDLGCGTGAIAAALLAQRPDLDVHAVDIDPAAVSCARRNLTPDRVHEGDLYAALPAGLRGRVSVVVANAPYVPTSAIATMPPEARDHEARVALDGGADGLDVQRRVAADAPAWLRPGGVLAVETSRSQQAGTVAALAAAGLGTSVRHDPRAEATVALGRLPTVTPSSVWKTPVGRS